MTGLGALLLTDHKYRAELHQENARVLAQASADTRNRMQTALTTRLHAVEDLQAFMLAPVSLPDNETFDRYAAGILDHSPTIRGLAYIDLHRIVRYFYPLKGNEAAIGLDLTTRPAAPFVEKAIRERRTTVNDPTVNVMGSLAVTPRTPLFRGDQLLGMVEGVFDVSAILQEVSTEADPRFAVQLRDAKGNRFWGAETFSGETQTRRIQVGDNGWTLVIGWQSPPRGPEPVTLVLIWGVGGALLLSLLFITNRTWIQTEWLQATISKRTAELRESEARFRNLTEMSSDFYWESDAEHRLIMRGSASKKVSTISTFQRGAQIGERRWEIPYLSPDAAGWQAHRAVLDAHLPFRNFELSRRGDDDSERFISISGDPVFDATGAFKGYRGIGTDITGRKKAEAKIQRLTQLYAALSQCNQAIVRCVSEKELFPQICRVAVEFGRMKMAWIGLVDPDTRMVRPVASFGDRADEYLHDIEISVDANNLLGQGPTGIAIRENQPVWCQDFQNDPRIAPWRERGARAGWGASASLPLHQDGVPVGVLNLYAGEVGAFDDAARNLLIEVATDISFALANFARDSKRKQTEAALARESHRNEVFLRNASDGVHIVDVDGNVLEVSDSFCRMLGYAREELLGANVSLWDAQESAEKLKGVMAGPVTMGGHAVVKTSYRRRDGSILDVEIASRHLELDGKPVIFASARDITKRIRAERELVESEARFRGLVEQSIAGIYIIQDGKFAYVNPRFAEIRGFGSADELIGLDPASLIAEKDRSTVAENNRRLLEGETQSIAHSFVALRKDGSTIEVGVHSVRATYRGRSAIIGLLQDVSEKKRAEEQIQHYLKQLKTAFLSTVEVATTLSEMRDPYTAGHERRVAKIAAAIGAELGLEEHRIEGLHVAGNLHDIGKITIPAEILSKPGKLTKIEYQLVQGHAQSSYDVLKDVEFPWPVAQVALQHHERMDGSGYPQGLKGEAILLEARIMAVADVVEAMSSHRPYRPGLGIDKALAEIERGRGTAYDADVVDVCLRLFRERHYQLPE